MSEQYPPQYPGQYSSQYPNQNPPQPSYSGGEMYPPPPPPPPPYQPQQPMGYAPPSQYPAAAGYAQYAPVPVARNSNLAVASLICGHMALSEIKKSGNILQGRGMAIAGLILGYLEIAFMVVYILIIAIASASGGLPS